MPKSPQNWPFLNRVILGLGRDTPMCVVYPCKSCFDPAKGTRPCDTPV
ncbi:Fluconazole resistance 1 [Gossypium arboreum]|uniref:Fluconazole resistance 1 n=1 Tax=Gossypium arboreum TaxID=29729 RepID=A0A0B0N700_GOSAR|nr:Fluconazole resistance 1 [Gossypium arboreum]